MITTTLTGIEKVLGYIERNHAAEKKALNTAIRGEGFRLMRKLQAEIREGAPGNRRFTASSIISQTRKKSKKVLNRLAISVRYFVMPEPLQFHFGWTGPKVSKSWKRLAAIHQEGFDHDVTETQRKYFAKLGGRIKGKARSQERAKYFFIKKETTRFKTLARPMIAPFWQAHNREVIPNIRRNFRLKLAGKRF
jgi:hypothetical protein